MATVMFYEKPDCKSNLSQKRLLEASGHTIVPKSLLTETWTAARLRRFFGNTPVPTWFNPAAPAVKSGAVNPSAVDAAEAFALMVADPLLIKRPLLEVDGQMRAGFDPTYIRAWIGLNPTEDGADVTGCSRATNAAPCPVAPEHL